MYTVTYKGKGQNLEPLAVPGVYPPFEVGVPRTFNAEQLSACGVSEEDAASFIIGDTGFVTLFNANRVEPLFDVTQDESPPASEEQ